MARTWLFAVAFLAGACADDVSSVGGSSDSSGGEESSGSVDPGCPRSRHEGPFELPDGVVGDSYEVRLFDYASIGGVGIEVSGDLPMGLRRVREAELSGVLEESGDFEWVLSTVDHWSPPDCPLADPHTTTFILTVVDPTSTSSTSGSTTSSTG